MKQNTRNLESIITKVPLLFNYDNPTVAVKVLIRIANITNSAKYGIIFDLKRTYEISK